MGSWTVRRHAVERLRRDRELDDQMTEGRDEVIRLQGRIRTIVSHMREADASPPRRDQEGD